MKKHISAFLIPFLLLQLYGCYSTRVMSYEELRNFEGPDEIIVKTDENEYLLNRKSEKLRAYDWMVDDNLLTIIRSEPINIKDYTQGNYSSGTQYIKINKIDIKSIEIDDFNVITTLIFLAGIGLLVALGYVGSMDAGAGSVSL